MTATFYLTLVLFIGLCALFALLILIQKGRGGGISSAFGGAGGNTAFGSKTGDVLTWATSVVFFLFLIFCVSLNLLAAKVNDQQTKIASSVGADEATEAALPTSQPATPPGGRPAADTQRLPVPALPPAEQPVGATPPATPLPPTPSPADSSPSSTTRP